MIAKFFGRALCFLLSAAILCFCACSADETEYYFVEFSISSNFYAGGQKLDNNEIRSVSAEVGTMLNSIEDDVSTEKNGSVARINAADAGEKIQAGEYTSDLFSLSKELYLQTNGAFSPALYNLSELWGFSPEYADRYTQPRQEPPQNEIDACLEKSQFDDIYRAESGEIVKKNAETRIDFGGIAKGYMSDCALALLRQRYGEVQGTFSVMSNSVLAGEKQNDSAGLGYTATLENPRKEITGGLSSGGALYFTGLSDVAVSTSADDYRYYVYDGKIYKHILDPDTGRPSDNGVISITVLVPLSVAHAGALADAYSTTGFCMPLTQALSFYELLWKEYGIGAVVITSDFCYYTVGEYTVLQPKEYAQLTNPSLTDKVENVFTYTEISAAKDEVVPCEKEREYIELLAARNG